MEKIYFINDNLEVLGKKSSEIKLFNRTSLEWIQKEICDTTIEVLDEIPTSFDDGLNVVIFSRYPLLTGYEMDIVRKEAKENTILYFGDCFAFYGSELKDSFAKKYLMDSLAYIPLVSNKNLQRIRDFFHLRINDRLLDLGVIIHDYNTTFIDDTVEFESGVEIYPNNNIFGNTVIKENAVIYPFNNITDSVIESGVTVKSSTLIGAKVGKNTTVGPNAYLRPNSNVGENCRVGDFVEIKNANIGNGTKISHLSYVGDADVGEKVNVGCGSIFVNYDGKNKHRTTVGNHCFIGSNCNVIAPCKIDDESFIAAGTTVTKDVPENSLVIGRVREEIKTNRAKKYLG